MLFVTLFPFGTRALRGYLCPAVGEVRREQDCHCYVVVIFRAHCVSSSCSHAFITHSTPEHTSERTNTVKARYKCCTAGEFLLPPLPAHHTTPHHIILLNLISSTVYASRGDNCHSHKCAAHYPPCCSFEHYRPKA